MTSRKVNSYLAVLAITVFGSLATWMIVDVATMPLPEEAAYAYALD